MSLGTTLPILRPVEERRTGLAACRFLHVGSDRIYNPLTDKLISVGDAGYSELRSVLAGSVETQDLAQPMLDHLATAGWLVPAAADLSTRFHLKYVSLEAHTVCNQSCYFCPVSIAPRQTHFMPTEQYEDILGQLAAYRHTIEAVFMISYNEPTVDKRFVDQVRAIRRAGLPPAVLTNGTGLTRDRIDALVELGGLRFLSINLSTLDRAKYTDDRGKDQLDLVLGHLDYARDKAVSEEMDIVVLGTGDEVHDRDFEAITDRYAGSRFNVKSFVVNDRAGYLRIGLRAKNPEASLCGCDHMGSRPLQHLHITPHAKCILCCQDYSESVVVGDLNEMSVQEVLTGPEMAKMRRWVYGIEPAPADFICRNCKFVLTR